MAAARLFARRESGAGGGGLVRVMVAFSALSMLPDIDVVGLALGVPYGTPFGHRGASHSLAVAALIGAAFAAAAFWPARSKPDLRQALRLGIYVAVVVASHGLLDSMTDGGQGVALLWPWTAQRYFAPWRPIPVAPIGVDFLSAYGMHVAGVELLQFAPVFAYALWPRRRAFFVG
jgi:inner membrane protein